MKILFYDWSLHIVGGGQKVNCRIIEHLSKQHDVDVLTLYPVKKEYLEKYYSVDLSKVNFLHLANHSKMHASLLKLLLTSKVSKLSSKYDVFFNADAQEAVKPHAKNNIMYCHFFELLWYRTPKNILDFFKLSFLFILRFFKGNYSKYYKIYCNSLYTKKWLKKLWGVDAKVIYPFVEIPKRITNNRENLIISTGRLSPDKNYEFVINSFKKIYDSFGKKYNCIIAAAGSKKGKEYHQKLIKIIGKYPVKIITDLTSQQLKKLYSKSKIFLMGKGIGIDENKFPTLLENFGMAPVEAMAYGCVPVVLNKAGYKETVENNKSGFLFDSEDEAIEKLKLLVKDEKLREKMSKQAISRAKKFSLQRMQKEINEMMDDL